MSVDVNASGSTFETGTAQRLFKSPATDYGSWDIPADGKRFLNVSPSAAAPPRNPITSC